MSAFLLGTGFRADMGTCIRKLVLLKLIDACEDDGSRIFPAIATVARAAQCSERQVQREIRAFLDAALLKLVREGGKGRRSTNEYALDLDVLAAISRAGWDAYVADRGLGAKGDCESPLEDEPQGDTSDPDRVTETAVKGDSWSRTTPPEPSIDPSERADARERVGQEDRKKIEARGWALLRDWPGFAGMPKQPALKAWMELPPGDQDTAERRYPGWLALLRSQGKNHFPAPSTYFKQRLFDEVPDPLTTAKPDTLMAPPFGPVWMAARLKQFLRGPTNAPQLTQFQEGLVRDGKAERATLLREKQARDGYPAVNAMHERARARQGVPCAASLEALSAVMEAVPVDGDVFAAWRLEHEQRGWPWIPDLGSMRVVYFPRGGPLAGMKAFEEAVQAAEQGEQHEHGGGREAAE